MSDEERVGREGTAEEVEQVKAASQEKYVAPEAEGQFVLTIRCRWCGAPNSVSSYGNYFHCWYDGCLNFY
ncbi:MAG: hypothetical protein KC492_24565 [Myxococcales bacterium]|nr:hypothetical protein [Myxococcales bacterium]